MYHIISCIYTSYQEIRNSQAVADALNQTIFLGEDCSLVFLPLQMKDVVMDNDTDNHTDTEESWQ